MPDDPIVIDDGGSTRIKRITNHERAKMDELMDVDDRVPEPGRAGSIHLAKAHGDGFNAITITRVNSLGQTKVDTRRFQEFKIESGDQIIVGVLDNKNVKLTLHGPSNNPPSVVAKNQKGKRRYIVENAPPIDRVKVGNEVFQPDADTVYTTVVVRHVEDLTSI